jgi:hypothetical protein
MVPMSGTQANVTDDLDARADLPGTVDWYRLADEWDYESAPAAARRAHRLVPTFYGAIRAVTDGDDTPGTSPSLATCEKVPTSGASGDSDALSRKLDFDDDASTRDRSLWERDTIRLAYRHDIGGDAIDVEDVAEAIAGSVDANEAIHACLGRDTSRQAKVVALAKAGEVPHAKRLATCGERSVQLRCPDGMAGGCGHEENYVPISCDSPLCPDCGRRRQGQAVDRYRDALEDMGSPLMVRLSLPERVEPGDVGEAVAELRDGLGRLRRRRVPFEGEHQGRRWVWADDGGRPADHHWKAALLAGGRHDLVRRWQRRCVRYEWEDVTGTHRGRGIPMDEVLRGGVYGIDAKQGEDGLVNVHAHILVDCPYIPQAALASVWDDVVGAPVVDVRRVEERGEKDRETALMETVGYAAKPPEYESLEGAVEYAQALKGAKLIQPFGSLHGNVPEQTGELLCAECGMTPAWWDYLGLVEQGVDTMGKSWDDPTQGENDPPEGDRREKGDPPGGESQ